MRKALSILSARKTLLGILLIIVVIQYLSSPDLDNFPEKERSLVLADTQNTQLGYIVSPLEKQHKGKTGVLLLDKGESALLWRGALVDQAEKSIDIQTFIWANDNVGTIAVERVLRAAQRGARARILIVDFMLSVETQHNT